jgi:ribokinase
MRDIVVVGSLNVDVSLRAAHLPRPGETVRAEGLEIGAGGKGTNQAIAAARLGGRVHMVGRVGDDAFSGIPLQALEAAGVDTSSVHALAGQHTGLASIVVDTGSGENQIAVAGGANRRLSPDHVRDAIAAFRSSGVLLVQLEAPLETVGAALDLAAECGLQAVFDPAPALELPEALLRKASILTPNETEAQVLTGIEVRDIESAAAAGMRLRDRSLCDVVVTLGAQGCLWVWSSGFEHIPAPRVEALDTTGAGDAFNGGLAVGLARGEPLGQALRLAVRAGTAATLRRGAAAAMPSADALARLPAG